MRRRQSEVQKQSETGVQAAGAAEEEGEWLEQRLGRRRVGGQVDWSRAGQRQARQAGEHTVHPESIHSASLSTFCYVTALFQNGLNSFFPSKFYTQYPHNDNMKKG